jgi:diguanylate cyclase (GGDEF)-like protein/PAS domain S-box-containing protein
MTFALAPSFPADEHARYLDHLFDLAALLDRDGTVLRANAAALDVLGYAAADLAGCRASDLVHGADRAAWSALFAAALAGSVVRDRELRWVRRDGMSVHLAVSARWIEADGVLVACARDVTAHMRAREELKCSRERLNAMLESIGDAFFAIDRAWRITYANRKAAEFVGLDVASSVGCHLLDLAPDLADSAALPMYREALDTGIPGSAEIWWAPRAAWLDVRAYPSEDGLSVYFHDVTGKRQAADAVRTSETRFREVIEMTPSGYVLARFDGLIQDVNPALCALTGRARADLVGSQLSALFVSCPWDSLQAARGDPLQGVEAVLLHAQGWHVHVLFNGSVRRDAQGNPESFTGLMTDITGRKQAESRLQELATHDTLTGLPNRTLLNERLQHMLDACREGESVAVLFLDLDRFKEVNDSFGHELGDVLLCEVAARLRKVLRPHDVIARLGGDEFVVAAACRTRRTGAQQVAARLLGALTTPLRVGAQEVIIGASIGISMYPHDAATRELLFQTADTAMYRAKAAGRNRACFFEPAMTLEAKARMTLEMALRPALARGEFALHYQPRIDLATMAVTGMEALLRWRHPELGDVPPARFVGIAEETGLIAQIGGWVLREACRDTRRLIDDFGRPVRVSVNVSARQLAQPGFVDEVRAVLDATGLPAGCLEIELTESALIEDIERTAGMLRELRALGVKLAVDDFGTGYSGLAYLRRFQIDVLKLDRSFVVEDDGGASAFDFIKAFVDMAHALRLSVVAEGVETAEVLDFLRAAACDEVQGYLLARPMPLPELRAYLGGA